MSCSKPEVAFNVVIPRQPPVKHLEDLQTYLGHPYYRLTQVFSIQDLEEKESKVRFYAMYFWDTKHKKGDIRACAASVWEILCDSKGLNIDYSPMTVVGKKLFRDHTQSTIAKQLLECKDKVHLVHGFTSNDPAGFSSFSRGYHFSRCVEHAVMCVAKTKLHRAHVVMHSAGELVNLALTSKFVQPHTLNAIVEGLENDARFDKNLPAGYGSLSEEEKRLWKESTLSVVRHRIRTMDPEDFKGKYLEWLDRNLTLDPIKTEQEVFKVEIGRGLLMSEEELADWNQQSGLLFLMASSKYLSEEPFNLRVALSCKDATILEIRPDDERYGVKPPNNNSLDFVKTAEGKIWFVGLDKTHGEPQREFLGKWRVCSRAASFDPDHIQHNLAYLTTSLSEYKHGVLGLIKRIVLNQFTEPILNYPALNELMSKNLRAKGLYPPWRVHNKVCVTLDEEGLDSFATLGHVGRPFY